MKYFKPICVLVLLNLLISFVDAQEYSQLSYWSDTRNASISNDLMITSDYTDGIRAFYRDNFGNWKEDQFILSSISQSGDYFGASVDLSGRYVIVGAYGHDVEYMPDFMEDAGIAYIYERNSLHNWTSGQVLVPPIFGEEDLFGFEVAVSGDWAMVGALLEDEDYNENATLDNPGAVYAFNRNETGNWYNKLQKLTASDRESNDAFGFSISMYGNYAIIGAPYEDHDENGEHNYSAAGSAYIFELDNDGVWREVQKIVSPDRDFNNFFGDDVSIYNDLALVGTYGKNYISAENTQIDWSGASYLFERNKQGEWSFKQKLVSSDSLTQCNHFGRSVSIDEDLIAIGAYQMDGDLCNASNGSVYIYKSDENGIWQEIKKINSPDGYNYQSFGKRVDISSDYMLINASNDYKGYCYLYKGCFPRISLLSDNILLNGGFDSCFVEPWHLNEFIGASAEISIVDNACVVQKIVLDPVPASWKIQLQQVLIDEQISKLYVGGNYRFSFDALAEAENRSCVTFFGNGEDPWTPQVIDTIYLGLEYQHFSYDFTLTETYPVFVMNFDLGLESSAIKIDNIRLTRTGPDTDNDGVYDELDNCVNISNNDQIDTDGDGAGNACDNCINVSSTGQIDSDGDGIGDACDNCINVYNAGQIDSDGDGVGNTCDNCPDISNTGQTDTDGNDTGDACETVGINTGNYDAADIIIFPNPATDIVTVNADKGGIITLYNSLGMVVKKEVMNDNQLSIDISDLPKGIYYIRVNNLRIFKISIQ